MSCLRYRHVQDFRQKVSISSAERQPGACKASQAASSAQARCAIESKKLALRIAALAKEKKALQVVVLDMRKICSFTSFFVIASGTSLRQVNALRDTIEQDLAKDKIKSLSKPVAHDESGWAVLDYSDVVVHLFYKPMRAFYDLEHLWSEATRVRITKKASAS